MAYSDFDPTFNMISSFLHPERAYEQAQKQAEEGWSQAQGYQKPFWQQGMEQYGGLNQARQNLLDPTQLQNQWAQSYEQSPYAQRQLAMNKQAGQEAASSMGLLGSSGALSNIQQGAGDIVSQDRQQYMKDLMEKYLAGIGLGENLYGVGAQTGQNLGNQAMQQGQNMAGLAYGRHVAPGTLFGNLLKGGAGFIGGGGIGNFSQGAQGAVNAFNQGGGV